MVLVLVVVVVVVVVVQVVEESEFTQWPFAVGVNVLISRVFGENKVKGVWGIPQSLGRHGESGPCSCSCFELFVSMRE